MAGVAAASPGGYDIYWYEGRFYRHGRILLMGVKSLDDKSIWEGPAPVFYVCVKGWTAAGDRGPIRVEVGPWDKLSDLKAKVSQVTEFDGLKETSHVRVQGDHFARCVSCDFANFGSVVAVLGCFKVDGFDGYFAGRKLPLLAGLGSTHTLDDRDGGPSSPARLYALLGNFAGLQLPGTGEEPGKTGEEDASTLAEKSNVFTRRARVWAVSVKVVVEDTFLVCSVNDVRALLWLRASRVQLGMVPTFWFARHHLTVDWCENDRSSQEVRDMAGVFELAASRVSSGRRGQSVPEARGKDPIIPIYGVADKFLCYNRLRQPAVPVLYTNVAKFVREWAEIDRQISKAEALKDEAEVALERGMTAGKGKDNEEGKD
ncbi:unnamed protein product, partial [Prorocentrum cordatum]